MDINEIKAKNAYYERLVKATNENNGEWVTIRQGCNIGMTSKLINKTYLALVSRLDDVIKQEANFTTIHWQDIYFAPENKKALHVSEINILELSETDLVRFFEFIILNTNDISHKRVSDFYFNSKNNI